MAMRIRARFCWLTIEPSMVNRTSKCSCARARSLLFVNPAQPMRGMDLTSCPGRNCSSRQFRFSSKRILTSGVGENFHFHFLEHGQHLRTFHAGETVQKNLDGIAGLEVVEKALHGHARPLEHQRAAKDVRIGVISAFFSHPQTIGPFDLSGKAHRATECTLRQVERVYFPDVEHEGRSKAKG